MINTSQENHIIDEYIEKIAAINKQYLDEHGRSKKMYIHTYGCQMNSHDSEKIAGMLSNMGYEEGDSEEAADIIVYNTCCIRENAENKIYGNLGYLKRFKADKKDLKIILCGCMMQQDTVIEKIRMSYRFVDVIFGTFNLYKLPELLYTNMETGSQIVDIWREQQEIVEDLPAVRKYPFKVGVNIMYGCDNYCTYCIVPYVRGRERSREPESILDEVEKLVESGVVEIMLLGQNVNSYGKSLDRDISFAGLLQMVANIAGIKRIRFMTSHPKDFSDELIQVIKNNPNVCKSVHLPIQSGSSKILAKMNRKYTKKSYLALVERLRAEIPGIVITTDIICGFPSETDEDNEETIDVIEKVKYAGAFTFIYSKRNGTPAAAMDCQIDENTIKPRFNKLLSTLNPIIHEISRAHVGNTYEVLGEEMSKNDAELITGRLDDNSIVHFKGDASYIGKFANVRITDCKTFYLTGEII